jgi:hypothetical protein
VVAGPGDRARVALTLRLRAELHERLRVKAFNERTTIQDIILERLKDIWPSKQLAARFQGAARSA